MSEVTVVEDDIYDLKPCPFCGGQAHLYCGLVNRSGFLMNALTCRVQCESCEIMTEIGTEKEVIDKWNRRVVMKEDTPGAVNLPYHYDTRDKTEYASDAVDHPKHYGGVENVYETIKVIEAWDLDFCLGNAVKYISRAGKKDPTKEAEDLKKAVWYLERRIHQLEGTECPK